MRGFVSFWIMMKQRTKWILGGIAGLVFLICLAGLTYYKFFLFSGLFDEGPTKEVNLAGWGKLEEGMTQEQVIDLLGDSRAKFHVGDREHMAMSAGTWQYNWKGEFFLVHPKAYVVYFDDEGKLASWREPIDGEDSPETYPAGDDLKAKPKK